MMNITSKKTTPTRIAQDAPADGQTFKHTPAPRPSEPEATVARI